MRAALSSSSVLGRMMTGKNDRGPRRPTTDKNRARKNRGKEETRRGHETEPMGRTRGRAGGGGGERKTKRSPKRQDEQETRKWAPGDTAQETTRRETRRKRDKKDTSDRGVHNDTKREGQHRGENNRQTTNNYRVESPKMRKRAASLELQGDLERRPQSASGI